MLSSLRLCTTGTATSALVCRFRGGIIISCRRSVSYSRMLDMGGAPSSHTDKSKTRINASKNCKLQAVCFDFQVLTKYTSKQDSETNNQTRKDAGDTPKLQKDATPDASMVQHVADLLNVNLGGLPSSKRKQEPQDDLSLLMGSHDIKEKNQEKKNPLFGDIRSKYADKLKKRGLDGGLAQVELAKHQVEETLKRGDAAGHLQARKIAAANPISRQQSWMALTGTGALLQYLTQRSIHIVLLPRPSTPDDELNEEEGECMQDFARQLKSDVVFSQLVKDGRPGAVNLVHKALQGLQLDPNLVLFVSDRDDYLRAAKEANMMTCRILPANGRRGNISAHFMVPNLTGVQDVVNEINGISYNAVFKSR